MPLLQRYLADRDPRSAWARNGKLTEVNSPSATTPCAPSGSAAATTPTNSDTVVPVATWAGSTPVKAAHALRERPTASSNSGGDNRPRRQPSSTPVIASRAERGGTPTDAVLR